jgi:AraC-like DNA-binding protein
LQVALVFGDARLDRPVRGADPLVRKVLLERTTADLSGPAPMLVGEVRHAIRSSMKSGSCTRASVAALLGVHERTFGRRLNAAGGSFQTLRQETRAAAARDLPQDSNGSLTESAQALGYHDVTVFTRAFVRWTGMTPREYRAGPASR